MSQIKVDMLDLEHIFGMEAQEQYVVPLYQREYAWGKVEIRQLLDDLWEAFKQTSIGNYHLGTLVVCRRFHNGNSTEFELIDGQQRLTTLSLLYRILNREKRGITRRIRFDNRPTAENFLNVFFNDPTADIQNPVTFRDAVDEIFSYRYSDGASDDGQIVQEDVFKDDGFKNFILTNVKLFRVEMPPSTDVAAYFEVMNNRGKQLEYHELIKAKLIAKLRDSAYRGNHHASCISIDELERRFDIFWTACAHMNGHLAMRLHGCLQMENDVNLSWVNANPGGENCSDILDGGEYRSVIDDFPNFLMHVLRLYLSKIKSKIKNDNSVRLDDRYLMDEFKKHEKEIDPYAFLDCLIRTRLRFDRYVVKAEFDGDAVSNWTLKHVVKYPRSYDLGNTFKDQEQIIKLESMLQVTFRTRRYKTWLYELLSSPLQEQSSLVSFLEDVVVRPRLINVFSKKGNLTINDDEFALGTATPHFLLNVIDYLLWMKDVKKHELKLNDFVFAYRSSIEHHHAQTLFEGEDQNDPWDVELNDIGNLCLVYPSENSSLSNHAPHEKVERFLRSGRSCPPKQQLMYRLTREAPNKIWTKRIMRDHSNFVKELVVNFIKTPNSSVQGET